MNNTSNSDYHFDIHSSVIFQLGESLITNEVQALLELVKNSYDACAGYVKITIQTNDRPEMEDARFPDAKGYIRVQDNGFGMTDDDIRKGWLLLSSRRKLNFKKSKVKTACGRVPLGDKGLGRLAVQQLGENVEILTRPKDEDVEYHVSFSWNDFKKVDRLSDVFVNFQRRSPKKIKTHGADLFISQIKNSHVWINEQERISAQLSKLILPYGELRDFVVYLEINGKRIDLADITEQIRDSAQLRYSFNFDGKKFHAKGKVKLNYIRPFQDQEEINKFATYVENDKGLEFLKYLQSQKYAKAWKLKPSSDDNWYVEYQYDRDFGDYDKLDLVNDKPANPGPFNGEIDAFSLGHQNVKEQNIFDTAKSYKELIKNLSGIRVYRDGFGIPVDEDWLELGKQQTGGISWYGLRPQNTMGYVLISAEHNSALEETTNREGFVNSPFYNNFFEIMRQFIKFTEQSQEFLRRGCTDFRRSKEEENAGPISDSSPEQLSQKVRNAGVKVKDRQKAADKISKSLESIAQKTDLAAQQEISDIQKKIQDFSKEIGEDAELEHVGVLLNNEIETLRHQLSQVYETVSLGLTAETLSHEIHHVADNIDYRSKKTRGHLTKKNIDDYVVVSYFEHIISAVSALRKQLSHLAPSLRYVRERKDTISLKSFFEEIIDYHKTRLEEKNIELQLICDEGGDFKLRMNQGKLIQIVDNIIYNSRYWLIEDIRNKYIPNGIITVEISKPFVRISDNGRGVDPSVEKSLFEAFITAKGKGKGRGLGLFIVRQLLETEGGTIRLLNKKNKFERLYTFEINFSGGISG